MSDRLNELIFKYRYNDSAQAGFINISRILKDSDPDTLTKDDLVRAYRNYGKKTFILNYRVSELDDLLDFYSILEMACSAHYLSGENDSFREDALMILDTGAVRSYIFEEYKSILPLQYLRRLQMLNDSGEGFDDFSAMFPIFLKFLMIYDLTREEDGLKRFISMDNQQLASYFNSLLDSPSDVKTIQEYIEGDLTEGFQLYLDFINLTDELVNDAEDFNSLKADIIQFFLKWYAFNESGHDKFKLIREFFDRLRENADHYNLTFEEVAMDLKTIEKLENQFDRITEYMEQASSIIYA